jgi:hypothetical protein
MAGDQCAAQKSFGVLVACSPGGWWLHKSHGLNVRIKLCYQGKSIGRERETETETDRQRQKKMPNAICLLGRKIKLQFQFG